MKLKPGQRWRLLEDDKGDIIEIILPLKNKKSKRKTATGLTLQGSYGNEIGNIQTWYCFPKHNKKNRWWKYLKGQDKP